MNASSIHASENSQSLDPSTSTRIGDSQQTTTRTVDKTDDCDMENEEEDDDDDSNDGGVPDISTSIKESEIILPEPRFRVKQRIYARDDHTTGLLYHGIVRKCQYGPKSKQVNLLMHLTDATNVEELCDVRNYEGVEEESWHYFIHHFGWSVNHDRWVEESALYEDNEKTHLLAKRLQSELGMIKKKERKEKVLCAMYKRIKELEHEILLSKEGENGQQKVQPAGGDSTHNDGNTNLAVEAQHKNAKVRARQAEEKKLSSWIENEKLLRTMSLQGNRPGSSHTGNGDQNALVSLPFPLKKILTEEWEVISCGNVHILPASFSVSNALHTYFRSKAQILSGESGETKDDSAQKSDSMNSSSDMEQMNGVASGETADPNLAQWNDMVEGVKLLFNQALKRQLLYKQEISQYLVLESSGAFSTQDYCDIYSSEYLLRLFVRFPALLEDASQRGTITQESFSQALFRINDMVRFLQRDPERYFTQSFRRLNADEKALEKKQSANMSNRKMSSLPKEPRDVTNVALDATAHELSAEKKTSKSSRKGFKRSRVSVP